MELYPLLKLIHIISSTVLYGTGIGSAYYLWRAHRTGDTAMVAKVTHHVVWADWLFTLPAVIIQPLTGFWLMEVQGYDFTSQWLHWSVVLYIIAGVCWIPVVWIQIMLRNSARDCVRTGKALPARYRRLMQYWYVLGTLAFIAVTVIFYLMVYRPV